MKSFIIAVLLGSASFACADGYTPRDVDYSYTYTTLPPNEDGNGLAFFETSLETELCVSLDRFFEETEDAVAKQGPFRDTHWNEKHGKQTFAVAFWLDMKPGYGYIEAWFENDEGFWCLWEFALREDLLPVNFEHVRKKTDPT